MKNSEWGAAAYLTHSQYGRNGYEISVNQCSSYITGVGRGLNNTEDESKTGTGTIYNSKYAYSRIDNRQKYKGEVGVLSSSTGNVYGIYDLSGGACEYVAGWDTNSTDSYLQCGSTFNGYEKTTTTNDEDGTTTTTYSATGPSTKYATSYKNGTEERYGTNLEHRVGKVGDATKEINTGANSWDSHWFADYSYLFYSGSPFFLRGGYYGYTSGAGVFYSSSDNGSSYSNCGFRVVLAVR